MGTVTVPADFFRQELRIYANWREALCRELLQNAIDAGPSRIAVSTETVTTADGTSRGRVVFTDNGCGMSRTTLEEVFFALGRTTKTGPDSIGGFGRARIIICFAQHGYTIESGNLRVTGHGGEYLIETTDRHVAGTVFTIDLVDDSPDRVTDEFRRMLQRSTLTVPVTLNGDVVHGRALPPRAKILRDDDGRAWARAYVQPNGVGRLDVRVHGLPMFTHWLGTDDRVVIELIPSRSREVLVASRDALKEPFHTLLTQFQTALSQNRRAALKPTAKPLDQLVTGGGFMLSAATDPQAPTETATGGSAQPDAAFTSGSSGAPGSNVPSPNAPGGSPAGGAPNGSGPGTLLSPANQAALALLMSTPTDPNQVERRRALLATQRSTLGFDVHLMADQADAAVRRQARAWDPSSWVENSGARRRTLVLAWKRAVGYAIELLLAQNPALGQVAWTVGLTFDSDVEAVCRRANGGFVLALNPVTSTGKIRYQVSSRRSRQRLLALALHEVSHIVHQNHDERFASLLTDLMALVDPIEADRIIRS